MNALNILNSIRAYSLRSINSSIQTVSQFTSMAYNNGFDGGGNEAARGDHAPHIVCGRSLCGSDERPTGEICRK